jgi:hypothetical protein
MTGDELGLQRPVQVGLGVPPGDVAVEASGQRAAVSVVVAKRRRLKYDIGDGTAKQASVISRPGNRQLFR